jgi:hypothetical protein
VTGRPKAAVQGQDWASLIFLGIRPCVPAPRVLFWVRLGVLDGGDRACTVHCNDGGRRDLLPDHAHLGAHALGRGREGDYGAAQRLQLVLQRVTAMFSIPRRYGHFVFAVVQSALTCLIAAGIASFPSITHWLSSWLIWWVVMAPIALLAAPAIRSFSLALTRE